MSIIEWTHPSVLRLLEDSGAQEPLGAIEARARDVALVAMEDGWHGPPYDPFHLADLLKIELVARQDLDDARLVTEAGNPRIEFNPARRPARVRFSIAHEIGHFLFPDYAQRVRYRDLSERRGDDWQLEILCNVAAAELIMPIGTFPIAEAMDLSLAHLLDQRTRYKVSTEALLRRVIKLTERPSCMFAAARLGNSGEFRLDYLVPSRSWTPALEAGWVLSKPSVLNRCTAVGFSDDGNEVWGQENVRVQAAGVPPYPGETFPRLVGLLQPVSDIEAFDERLRYLRGDASQPHVDAPTIIAHVVNDRARSWGGRGFAQSLMSRFPAARDDYAEWTAAGHLASGAVHLFEVADGLWIASLVAQAGYGDATARPRIRLGALQRSLATLATLALERGANVHMPAIGTGQGGGRWPEIRDLILEELASRRVDSTVYVLPDEPMPEDAPVDQQLSLI